MALQKDFFPLQPERSRAPKRGEKRPCEPRGAARGVSVLPRQRMSGRRPRTDCPRRFGQDESHSRCENAKLSSAVLP